VAEGITNDEADAEIMRTPASARLNHAMFELRADQTPCGRPGFRGRMEATNSILAMGLEAAERRKRGL